MKRYLELSRSDLEDILIEHVVNKFKIKLTPDSIKFKITQPGYNDDPDIKVVCEVTEP